jgi:hypothetical protein
MGQMRNAYKILVGKPEGKYHAEDLRVDRRIILEWILGEKYGKLWIEFIWLRTGTGGGFL